VSSVFVWIEARKEVVFLCGNFEAGVSQASVLEQLDTASFSQYEIFESPAGRTIEFNSVLNFAVYNCLIKINAEGLVDSAGIALD